MSETKTVLRGLREIDDAGILLVFPIDNRREPPSLWYRFHPRTPLRWEWDESGDDRLSRLWRLRAELSSSGKVVYTKWYQGRATFFSRAVFAAMLRRRLNASSPANVRPLQDPRLAERIAHKGLSPDALTLLRELENDSPLSTKTLKRLTGMQGRFQEAAYQRGLKELWSRLLIVGYGEVDEGAFPSLAIGATRLVFEELWNDACFLSLAESLAILKRALPQDSLFLQYAAKLERSQHRTQDGHSFINRPL